MKYRLEKLETNFYLWLARHTPSKIRYWMTVQSCAIATSGDQWGNTVVSELSMMDMLQRIEV